MAIIFENATESREFYQKNETLWQGVAHFLHQLPFKGRNFILLLLFGCAIRRAHFRFFLYHTQDYPSP